MTTSPPPPQNLAERLGPAYVGLRPDLEIHRHLFQGVPSYVIRDPLTLQCHRVNKKEYVILVNLTTQRNLSETFDYLVSADILKQKNEEEFYRFVVTLHQLAFLNLPVSDDKSLYRRYLAKQNARRKEKLMSFLFLRIPLINPDAFLNKTMHLARPFFCRWFFLVWLALMGAGGVIICQKRHELFVPLTQMFAAGNIICMWVVLILLKVFHEFGHAFACKSRGGYVPEMGIYLIALTPCAYVDVTSSWSFSRKRDRLLVGLAGVYIESFIAMLALLVWVYTDSAAIKLITHNIFFLAGIVTLLMNINPLMRFDGYYVLSDLLEVPNLRRQGQGYVIRVLKRIFLGVKIPDLGYNKIMLTVLFVFGLASSLYKTTVVLSISILLATKFFLVGLLMGVFYIGTTLTGILRRTTRYLWKSPESAPVRVRAVGLSLLLLLGIPSLILYLPVPTYLRASGQLVKEHEHVVYAQHDGFIREISAVPGEPAQANMQLAQLENTQLAQRLHETRARLAKAQIKLNSYRANNPNHPAINQQQEFIKTLAAELQFQQAEMEKLNVYAPGAGMIIEGLDAKDVGRFVRKGQPLAGIVSGGWMARILITEHDIAQAQPQVGQEIQLRFSARPDLALRGRITRISPAGSHQINMPALTNLGAGEIMVNSLTHEAANPYYELAVGIDNPEAEFLRYGMTGRVKLKTAAKPIGASLLQKILRFVNNLNRG